MSFEITEQVKYRLTGGVILITLAMIFMPMLMKKSNQRFEENLSLSLRVPPKPQAPVLKIPSPEQVFNKVKAPVQHELPHVAQRDVKIQIAKAKPLVSSIPTLPLDKAEAIVATPPKVAVVKAKPSQPSNGLYGVQLASFSRPENADFLVKRLQKLGYDAQSSTLENKNGKIYKVVVGQLKDKNKAIELQKKLAENVQLNGMVVKQG
jgi:DedD protein